MNINTRLEKLEDKTNINGAYCGCGHEIRTAVLLPDLSITDEEQELRWQELTKPQFCVKCGKGIDVRHIKVEYKEPAFPPPQISFLT